MSLNCHVDHESLWMVSWDNRRNTETGSRTGVSDWSRVLRCLHVCRLCRSFRLITAGNALMISERTVLWLLVFVGCCPRLTLLLTALWSSSDLAGILFPAVPAGIPFPVGPAGPVGLYGTLSPSDATAVDPDGTLSSSDLAGMLFPAVPAGIPFPVGPVGPCGTLSPSNYVSVVLVFLSSDLARMRGPATPTESEFLMLGSGTCCPHWPVWDAVPI